MASSAPFCHNSLASLSFQTWVSANVCCFNPKILAGYTKALSEQSTWNKVTLQHRSAIHVWNNDKVKTAVIPKPQMKFGKADWPSPGQSPSLNFRPPSAWRSEGTCPTQPFSRSHTCNLSNSSQPQKCPDITSTTFWVNLSLTSSLITS